MSISIQTIEDIKKVTESLYMHTANSIEKFIKKEKVNVACHSGCDKCCKTIRVEILTPEAFYIVDNIKKQFSVQQINELLERLELNNSKAIHKSLSDYGKEEIECAFLINNKCSIYDFRPYKCRAFLATDADFCKRDRCWTEQVPKLNQDLELKKTIDKYFKTLKENSLDNTPAELSNAILTVLKDENLLNKYLSKEYNFFDKLIDYDK